MVDWHIADPSDRECVERPAVAPLRRVDRDLKIGDVPSGAQCKLQRFLLVAHESDRARRPFRRRQGLVEYFDDGVNRPHRQFTLAHGRGFWIAGRGVQALGQEDAVMFECAVRVHGEMDLELARVRRNGGGAEHRRPRRGAADAGARAEETA